MSDGKTRKNPSGWKAALAVLIVAFGTTTATCGLAQTGTAIPASQVNPDSALSRTLRSLEGRNLGLEEARQLGLEASPEMARARADLRAVEALVLQERGAFDPELFADVTYLDDETPTASIFTGAEVLKERTTTSSVGARTTLPPGTEVEARLETQRIATNNELSNLDPEFRSTSRLEVRQPLLRGFGSGTSGDWSAAQQALEAERWRAAQVERGVLARIETLYWQLYAAERDYAAQRLIVQRSSALLDQARLRAEAGLIGPNQVANARVFDAQQRLALLDLEEGLDAASDALSEVVGERPAFGRRFHTIDEPDFDDNWSRRLDPGDVLSRALASNFDLRAARLQLEADSTREDAAASLARPRLDFIGSLGGRGLGGRGRDVTFGGNTISTDLDTGLGDAVGQSLGFDHRFWSVGVEFNLPLGLHSDRGRRDERRANLARQRHELQELERRIESEVRDALRRLRHGEERLALSREAVDAAREQVRVGLTEFENGRSTAFELVRLGADLATSEQELSRALVRTATARVDLLRLLGEETAALSSPPKEEP